jgi:hypothetical protein
MVSSIGVPSTYRNESLRICATGCAAPDRRTNRRSRLGPGHRLDYLRDLGGGRRDCPGQRAWTRLDAIEAGVMPDDLAAAFAAHPGAGRSGRRSRAQCAAST